MKRFICYLYEYQNGKRIRNTGFSKVEEGEEICSVSIHGKGWGKDMPGELNVYLFYMENGCCCGYFQGILKNIHPALNYRILYRPDDVGGKENFDKIEGVILCEERNPRYAAVWTDEEMEIREIKDMEEENRKEEEEYAEEKEVFREEIEEDEENESEENEGEEAEENEREEEMQEKVVDMTELCVKEQDRKKEDMEISRFRCTKINRKEIATLVRREWHLANNSFLLHGYYNYHHLAFIEEDLDLYLGIPGIYCEKEKRAAQAFGFPRFVKWEDDMINLTDGEKDVHPDFGYWCRQVHKIRV